VLALCLLLLSFHEVSADFGLDTSCQCDIHLRLPPGLPRPGPGLRLRLPRNEKFRDKNHPKDKSNPLLGKGVFEFDRLVIPINAEKNHWFLACLEIFLGKTGYSVSPAFTIIFCRLNSIDFQVVTTVHCRIYFHQIRVGFLGCRTSRAGVPRLSGSTAAGSNRFLMQDGLQ
jgi:hypothetical protein